MAHPFLTYRQAHYGSNRQSTQAAPSNPTQAPNSGNPGGITYVKPSLGQSLGSALLSITHPPPQPYPIKDAGVRAGEIVGYRAWFWDGTHLRSMANTVYAWTPGSCEGPADLNTGFGFHAYKSLESTVSCYGGGYNNTSRIIYGSIDMWGTVIEHDNGYRSEYAAVSEIYGRLDEAMEIIQRQELDLVENIRKLYQRNEDAGT